MEAGKTKLSKDTIKIDLVDAMIKSADPNISDEESEQMKSRLSNMWIMLSKFMQTQ